MKIFLFLSILLAALYSCNSNSNKTDIKVEKYNNAYRNKENKKLKITDLKEREIPIIDVHEHVQTIKDAEILLEIMNKYNIKKTCLMSSSIYTFTLDNKYGFERFKENNETLIELNKKYPERFSAFITINPLEKNNLELVKDYVNRGAEGIKLYIGHGAATGKGPFHSMPIDDKRMLPIYQWAEQTQLPILMHVNLTKYYSEFMHLLELFPNIKICIPHFGLHKNTAKRLNRLGKIFDKYPNVYTDCSFGHPDFHIEGFEAMSKWRSRSKEFIEKYADHIMYGTDMVIEKSKTKSYVENTIRSYMQWIESSEFLFFLKPKFPMWGLNINTKYLKKIYWTTPNKFLLKN